MIRILMHIRIQVMIDCIYSNSMTIVMIVSGSVVIGGTFSDWDFQ